MKDNQNQKPGNTDKGQDQTDSRSKKSASSQRENRKSDTERRSSDKISRKGETTKRDSADDKNPAQDPGVTNTGEKNKPWKDPDPTTPEKQKEIYATPGDNADDDTSINPRPEDAKQEKKDVTAGTSNTPHTDEYIEEERQRTGQTGVIEGGDEQRSDPGTFDPQAGTDTGTNDTKTTTGQDNK